MIRFRVRPAVAEKLARSNVVQRDLAQAIRVSDGYLSQLLKGIRCPGPRVRDRLASSAPFHDLSFDDLFERVASEATQ